MLLGNRPTDLLIIAHSQGTIIVLEELRKRRWASKLAALQSVTLITFGSPMTYLYQHYFPLLYGDLTKGRWRYLQANVPKWVNVYRIDDYVGTHIDSPVGTVAVHSVTQCQKTRVFRWACSRNLGKASSNLPCFCTFRLEFASQNGQLLGTWPLNLAIQPGLLLQGHTRYWEPAVLATVAAHLP